MNSSIHEVYDEIRASIKSLSNDKEIQSILKKTALDYGFENIYEMLINNIDIVLQFLMLKALGSNEYFGISEKNEIENLTETGDILLWLEINSTWNDIYLKRLNKIDFLRLTNNLETLCVEKNVFKIFGYTMALGNVFYIESFASNIKLKIVSFVMGFIGLYVNNKNYALKTIIEFIENVLWNEVYMAEHKLK